MWFQSLQLVRMWFQSLQLVRMIFANFVNPVLVRMIFVKFAIRQLVRTTFVSFAVHELVCMTFSVSSARTHLLVRMNSVILPLVRMTRLFPSHRERSAP